MKHLLHTGLGALLALALVPLSTSAQAAEPATATTASPGSMAGTSTGTDLERPSFDCAKASGAIELLICKTPELARLDREVTRVFALASSDPAAKRDRNFKAMQRGWIKGRNECWKSTDQLACVRASHVERLAELRRDFPAARRDAGQGITIGPRALICPGMDAATVTFVNSDPGAVALFMGQQRLVLAHVQSASGARYAGKDWDDSDYVLWNKGSDYRLERPGKTALTCHEQAEARGH